MWSDSSQRSGVAALVWQPRAKRRLASISPFAAAVLLTAAIFLLPAVGENRAARASVDEFTVAATHMNSESVARLEAAGR